MLRTAEAAAKQSNNITTGTSLSVQATYSSYKRNKISNTKPNESEKQSTTDSPSSPAGCWYCGAEERHSKTECPATGKECNHCKKIGHFSKVCKQKAKTRINSVAVSRTTKTMAMVTNDQLVSITFSPQQERAANIRTLPDTGTEIDAIPATIYCKFFKSVALKIGSQPYTATGNPITSLGTFQATISWLPDGAPTTVHVLRDLQQPILSKSTQLAIGMLPKGYPQQRVNQVSTAATRAPPLPHNKPSSCFPHVQTRHIPTVATVVTANTPPKRVRMEHDLN